MRRVEEVCNMFEVEIPRDVTKFKTTLIGPFTTRQVVCGSICVAVEYIAFSLLHALHISMSLDSLIGIGLFLAVPIMAFAVLQPFGMPLEIFLKNALLLGYFAPKQRPYQIENVFAGELSEEKEDKKQKNNKDAMKKLVKDSLLHPDNILYQ